MVNQTDQAQVYIQLLVGSGLVSRAEFADFKRLAKELKMPLVQTIMNSGSIKKESLNLTADALQRVQSKQISPDLAIRALRIAFKKSIGLAEAINAAKNLHKSTGAFVSATNDLSNLLLDANVIKRDQIGSLLVKSHESSIMIGQVMIIEGVVSVPGLLNALMALILIKESGLKREDGLAALKHAYQNRVTIEQALFELGKFVKPNVTVIRIGELFLMANLITLEDFIECFEIEMFKQKKFNEILLERGMLHLQTVEYANQLLDSIKSEILKPVEAAIVLKRLSSGEDKILQVIHSVIEERIESENHKLGDLIVEGGFCSRDDLESAISSNSNSAVKVGSALIKANLISDKHLYSALRLQTALRQGYIDRKTVVELLKYCQQNKKTLDEAFVEIEIHIPSRMQWSWV